MSEFSPVSVTTTLRRRVDTLARRLRYQLWAVDALRFRGTRFACPVCGGTFRQLRTVDGVCSIHDQVLNLHTENAECPRCRSGIRQRFAFHEMLGRTNIKTASLTILHFAPDPGIYKALSRYPNLDYIVADINPGRFAKATRLDISDIDRPPDSVDGIICIHVLEHIPDDRRAIAELFRVAKPGAWALIAVPTYGATTFEDTTLDYAGRERIYGTGDHLRLNGLDFADKLREAGFSVETVDIVDRPGNYADRTAQTPHTDSDRYLFWCVKPGRPQL
jgi:SAM-dependent methyltransferase